MYFSSGNSNHISRVVPTMPVSYGRKKCVGIPAGFSIQMKWMALITVWQDRHYLARKVLDLTIPVDIVLLSSELQLCMLRAHNDRESLWWWQTIPHCQQNTVHNFILFLTCLFSYIDARLQTNKLLHNPRKYTKQSSFLKKW